MSDLREIYQQVVLDHNRSPRNYRKPDDANCSADGHNPLCGDQISVYLRMEDNSVKDVGFQGKGCAICMASASIMTETVKGRSGDEAEALFGQFHDMLTRDDLNDPDIAGADLGKLKVFAGVREFPVRVKCATLPWHTFHAAMTEGETTVTTES